MSLKTGLIGLALLVGTWLLYAPMLRHPYLYEDVRTVQQMTTQPPALWPPSSRMVTSWSYALLPADAPTQHAAGVWLHLLNGALVGLLAWRFGVTWWLAAGVFLWHPLAVQAVAYTAQRSELLAATGVLGAILCVLWPPTLWTLVLFVLSLVLGLGAKESAVAVVFLLPLVLLTQDRMDDTWWWLSLTVSAGAVVIGASFVRQFALDTPASALQWAQWQSTAIWRELVGWPFGQAIEHHVADVSRFWQWLALGSWLGVGGLAYVAWQKRWRGALALSWVWLALLPRLLVQTPSSTLTEHQLYLAQVGVALVIAETYS